MVLENDREPRILTKLTRSDGHQAYLFKVWRFFVFFVALSLSLFFIFSSLIFSPRRFYDILPFSAGCVFCSVTTVHCWPLLYRFTSKKFILWVHMHLSFISYSCCILVISLQQFIFIIIFKLMLISVNTYFKILNYNIIS